MGNIRVGQLYLSESITFEVVDIVCVTRWISVVKLVVINNEFLSRFVFDVDSNEMVNDIAHRKLVLLDFVKQ